MTEQQKSEAIPTRAEAQEYKEELGVVRTREEAEAIVQQKTSR